MTEEARVEQVWDAGSCFDSKELWEVFSTQPGIGIAFVDVHGRVLYANEEAARVGLQKSVTDVTDQLISDLFPGGAAVEIAESIARVIDNQIRVVRRTVWFGRPLQTTFESLPSPDDNQRLVLVTTRIGLADTSRPNTEYADTKHVELGKLDILTPREIEVLALMGEGRRIKEIATMLSRSPKTIESHKEGIGRKLRITDRARFIEIARNAGLSVETAFRERVHLTPKENEMQY